MSILVRITCSKCGAEVDAEKIATRVRRRVVWMNRCLGCGTTFESLPPRAAAERQRQRALERAGQMRLLP